MRKGRIKGSKNKWVRSLEERFWEKVNVTTNIDECWEWQAYVHPSGYGNINVNGKMRGAHQVAWELTFGPIPLEMLVCHICDNRKCANPNHLFLGSFQKNIEDRDMKHRGKIPDNRGEKHGMSKLKREDILEIRRMRQEGSTQKEIAVRFGIVRQTVSKILLGKAWDSIE